MLEDKGTGGQDCTAAGHEFSEAIYSQGGLEQCAGGSNSGVDDFLLENLTSYNTGQRQCSEVSPHTSVDRVSPPISSPTHIGQEGPMEDSTMAVPSFGKWEISTTESAFGQKRKQGNAVEGFPSRSSKRRTHIAGASQPQRLGSCAPGERRCSRAHDWETRAHQSPARSTRNPGPHRQKDGTALGGRVPIQQAAVPSVSGFPPSTLPIEPPITSCPPTAESARRKTSTSAFPRQQRSDLSCARCDRSADRMLQDVMTAISSEALHQHLVRNLDDELPREELVRLVSRTCCAFIHGHWEASRGRPWTHSNPGIDPAFSDSAILLDPTGRYVDDSLSSARSGRSRPSIEPRHSATQKQGKGVQKWQPLEDQRLRAYRQEKKNWEFICAQFPHRTRGALQFRANLLGV